MWNHDVTSITSGATVPPILRLPPSVRQRIYLHVGLIPTAAHGRPCVLDLHGHNQSLHFRFHGLLVSCRTIYAEASDILYSANRFIIRERDRRSLEPLRNLSPRALSNLTYLKIILNEASCHGRHEAAAYSGWRATQDHKEIATQSEFENFLDGHNVPLWGSHRPPIRHRLTEWDSTVAHLSAGITTKQLELCVVCDLDARDTTGLAERVVEPLSQLPQLKNCHLRLSRTSTPELNDVARRTSLQLRGLSSQPPAGGAYTGSRLVDLPRELRFRILEHTDLITPWKEVTWSRQHQAFLAVKAFCAPLDNRGEECPPHVHHGCQFADCWEPYPGPYIGCFCRVQHSAFSSTCMCWTPPRDLFLICRTLYEDSLAVFYSGNRFVVHDYNHQYPFTAPLGVYSSPRLAASTFFTDVVPERCLKELRFVELVFPPYSHDGWPNEAALKDWSHTMDWASKRLNLPGLAIRLIMAGLYGYQNPDRRAYMTEDQGNRIISIYERIAAPIARLGSGGLAKFFSSFAWPWAYTEESYAMISEYGWDWVADKERVLEERYGRLVMGDRYDEHHCGSIFVVRGPVNASLPPEYGGPTNSSWVRKHFRDW